MKRQWTFLSWFCQSCEKPKIGEIWQERKPTHANPLRVEIRDVSIDAQMILYAPATPRAPLTDTGAPARPRLRCPSAYSNLRSFTWSYVKVDDSE